MFYDVPNRPFNLNVIISSESNFKKVKINYNYSYKDGGWSFWCCRFFTILIVPTSNVGISEYFLI